MDAVKVMEEHRRMYKVTGKHLPTLAEGIPAEDVVKEVKEWSAEHPRKTRQSVFLEHYPDAPRDKYNLLTGCPKCLDANASCFVDKNATVKKFKCCAICRREFWRQEVE